MTIELRAGQKDNFGAEYYGGVSRTKLGRHFMASASISVMSLILVSQANAQVLPAECTPNPATNGAIIDCVAPAPTEIDGISTNVDDLTVNVGDATTPTTVNETAGVGVDMSGAGSQTLNIINSNSRVTGSNIGVRVTTSAGVGDLTIVSEGTISGYSEGITALNQGNGNISITAAEVSSTFAFGTAIAATNSAISSGEIAINSLAGSVTSNRDGIFAQNSGVGQISITSSDVSSVSGNAVMATILNSYNTEDISINTSAGSVSAGGFYGILGRTFGLGGLNIFSADVEGAQSGIRARIYGPTNTNGIVINSLAGIVTGGDEGIYAGNFADGGISITSANVTGSALNSAGIRARIFAPGSTGNLGIDSSAGNVSGDSFGIYAFNLSDGALSITSADVMAVGSSSTGIHAFNNTAGPGGVSVNSVAGNVSGGRTGILARNDGGGVLNVITADVTATGPNSTGIEAFNFVSSTGDLIIDSTAGTVTGENHGIYARTFGTGSMSISTADATGTTGNGIFVFNDGSNLSIDSTAGSVRGGGDGISVISYGTGNTTISAAESTGDNRTGISVVTGGPAIDLSISASGQITGGSFGLSAQNNGTGATNITVASATGIGNTGIEVNNGNSATDLFIDASGTTTGPLNGFLVRNEGTGETSVTAADSIGGMFGVGIEVTNGLTATDLTISSTGTATGGTGISAYNNGTGNTEVQVNSATGVRRHGVYAFNGYYSNDLSVTTTGEIIGDLNGVRTQNEGLGNTSIEVNRVTGGTDGIYSLSTVGTTTISLDSTAAVTGQSGYGIRAESIGTFADITIQGASGDVIGATDGIRIVSAGLGNVLVEYLDSVTGQGGDGIEAITGGGNVSINAIDTILGAGGRGIAVSSFGGDISIQGSGLVGGITGSGFYSSGINVRTSIGGYIDIGGIDAIGDVTGSGNGIDASAGGTYGGINISSIGDITGARYGILALNSTQGGIALSAANVTSTSSNGIRLVNYSSGSTVDVSVSGDVTGQFDGLGFRNSGTDGTNIDVFNATGMLGYGVRGTSNGDLSISSVGGIYGGRGGIFVGGSGSTDIAVNNVTGGVNDGIRVTGGMYGDNISIVATGDVSGGNNGVLSGNYGSGSTSITVNNVTASNLGISARNGGNTSDLTIVATGDVIGGTGISATNITSGMDGVTSVTANNVSGTVGNAISVQSSGSDISIMTSGDVIGNAGGINVSNNGNGSLAINANNVSGSRDAGILAINGLNSTDLNIDVTGDVSGANSGIIARNNGAGALTINANNVAGNTRLYGGLSAGIDAYNSNRSTGLNITAAGDISSENWNGVNAIQRGTGDLSITTEGSINAQVNGIFAVQTAGGSLFVTANDDVTGARSGINVRNYGNGTTRIDATSATGGTYDGIFAYNRGSAQDITISSSGDLTGRLGVFARNNGTRNTNIVVNNATGTAFDGVLGFNAGSSDDLNISVAGNAIGARNGIFGYSNNGSLNIDTVNASGENGTGIFARNRLNSTDINIDVFGNVSGSTQGINVANVGTGTTTITLGSEAVVTGQGAAGIAARSEQTNSDITIQGMSGEITGATDGVNIVTIGADILVDSLDSVTGQAGDGIDATSNGGAITINEIETIVGTGGNGINAVSNGGDISIQSVGQAGGGEGADSSGIYANASGGSTGAINIGGISANGDVTGTRSGIEAWTDGSGGIVIDSSSGIVSGGTFGVAARNNGTGSIDITTADVRATGSAAAISVTNTGGDVTIDSSAGIVQGSYYGIFVSNNGSGSTSIISDETNTPDGFGILVENGVNTTDLSIESTRSISEGGGIRAVHEGSGDITILSGVSTSSYYLSRGISASNSETGSNILVTSTESATGGQFGILARNYGTGDTEIVANNASGSGQLGSGVVGLNLTNSANLTITTTGTVSGESSGIIAENQGSGSTNVRAFDVTASNNNGIVATNQDTASNLTIESSGTVTSSNGTGITAVNRGTGITSVTANNVNATTGSGISVYGGMTGERVAITTNGDVSGGTNGIFVDAGTGDLDLAINGNVSGGDNGLVTITQNGTILTVQAGQSISGGANGIATMAESGSATSNDNLNIQGTVNGAIQLFEGDDSLTLAAGSAVNGALRGGEGFDTLNFDIASGMISNSGSATDGIAEFEIYNFNGGNFMLSGLNSGLNETNFNGGNNILAGTLESDVVLNGFGSSLQIADGTEITGNVTNDGRFALNSAGVGRLDVDGNFTQTGTGVITLGRTGLTSSDLIAVSGDLNLAGTLTLNQTTFFNDTITLIDGGTGLTGSFDTVNGLLSNGLLLSQAIDYDLQAFDVNLVTTIADASTIDALNSSQVDLANTLTTQLSVKNLNNGLDDLALRLAAIGDIDELKSSLDELNPEIVDAGIQVFENTQLLFMMKLLDQPGSDEGSFGVTKTVSNGSPHISRPSSDGPYMWGSIGISHYDQDGNSSNIDYETDGMDITAGVADIDAGPVKIGLVAGFEELNSASENGGVDRVRTQVYRLAAHGRAGINAQGNGLNAQIDAAIGFATGTNDVEQNILAPSITTVGRQNGRTGIESFNAITRLSLIGANDENWIVKPYLLAGYETLIQDGFMLGTNEATALQVNEVRADRYSLGYGASIDHDWGEGIHLNLSFTGIHHLGDTETNLVSQFTSTNSSGFNFGTQGKQIENQYVVKGGLGREFGKGWSGGAEGFAEFGDIEGYGGRVRIAKTF